MNFDQLLEDQENILQESPNNAAFLRLSKRAKSLTLPTRKMEDWQYAPLNFLNESSYEWGSLRPFMVTPDEQVKIQNGILTAAPLHRPGFQILSGAQLDKLSESQSAQLNHWFNYVERKANRLGLQSLSRSQNFYVVLLGKEFDSSKPLYVSIQSQVAEDQAESQLCFSPSLLFLPEVESHLLVEILGTGPAINFPNLGTVTPKNQVCHFTTLQNESLKTKCFISQFHLVEQKAKLDLNHFSIGAQFARVETFVSLQDVEAAVGLNGLFCGMGEQHTDHLTEIHHLAAETQSQEFYKGLLGGKARGVFNGKIKIESQAQKSNSSMLNKNLMLTRQAEVNTKPELEVLADDVKAGHGATIGQIQEEEIFYLQSRAISRPEALQVLSIGFAQEIAYSIQQPDLREFLLNRLDLYFQRFLESEVLT